MKNRFNSAFGILLLAIILCDGCQKTDSIATPTDPLEEKVTASVNGRVIDEQHNPVAGAQVQSGASTTSTDVNGVFRFSNIQMTKNAGFVTVEKNGYFRTGRTFFTNAGVVNNIEIKLIPKWFVGSFGVSSGGTIDIGSGSSVNFPANGVINKTTNALYTGVVTVFGKYLDPEDPELASIMPGNLTGISTSNEQKILQTYGMIAIELEGSNGEQLKLANAKQATINFPIPSRLLANAPATIPLWHFNDTLGIWKEDGTASRQGNAYVGTVTHFSFWNIDVPGDFINLTLILKNQNQELLPGYRVGLRNTQNNSQVFGTTDSSGSVNGPVPIGVPIEMLVYDKCNTVIHTQNIGPFATDTDLGLVTVTTGSVKIKVSGSVINCNQAPVTNGFVDVIVDGRGYRSAIHNGSFSMSIQGCSSFPVAADVTATDLEANMQSSTHNLIITSTDNTDNLLACGTYHDQSIQYNIGTDIIDFSPSRDSMSARRNGTTTTIEGFPFQSDSTNFKYTSFNFIGAAASGTYNISAGTFIVTRGVPSTLEYTMEGPISIEISEYSGQYVMGYFGGNFRERYSNVVVSGGCHFRVHRF